MLRFRIWDTPQRLVHWSLAALVFFAWATAEDKGVLYVLHTSAGYLVFLLVIFRIAWGFAGSTHARFGDFVRGWPAVRHYSGRLLRLRPERHAGHNPLGGWAVVIMLALAFAVTVTGMIGAARQPGALLDGLVSRSLARGVREIHETLANLLIVLALVHVAAVALDSLLTRDNLVRAMVDGTKAARPGERPAPARGGSMWLAAALAGPLIVLAVVMFGGTRF